MSTNAVAIPPAFSPARAIYSAAAVAMIAVIAEHLQSQHHTTQADGGMSGMANMPEIPSPAIPVAILWGWWVTMASAMMLPVVAAEADSIAAASRWRRRYVAVIEYLVGYLAVWAVFGLAATTAVAGLWPRGVPAEAPAVALLIAAIWQINPLRKKAMRRCSRSAHINVWGWAADRDCVIEGLARGRRCVLTCAPVMGVMALSHSVILMLALTALLLSERAAGPNPQRRVGRPLEAVVLAGLAFGVGVWVQFGGGWLP
jgi:predicted metal-binding membrane protein